MRVFTVSINIGFGTTEQRQTKLSDVKTGLESIGVNLNHIHNSTLYDWKFDAMVTEKQMVDLVIWGIEFKILHFAEVGTENAELVNRISAITHRLDEISSDGRYNPNAMYNEKVGVHTPGNMLTHYNETLLLEDHCTDRLQDALDKGWRLIACCPQPDGRRPDYVLGRYNAGHVLDQGALREP